MKGGEITNIFKNIYNSIFQNTGSNNAILCILTIIVTIIVVVYTIVILYIANNDNNTTTLTTQYTYLALIIIPIIFAFFSLFQILINDTIAFNTFLLMLIICISAFIIFIYTYLSSGYLNVVKNILYIILFFIVFVALTIYAAIFVNDVRKQNNWFGFFSNFVFYLPCLFIEFINYLMLEMKMTPQPVYVLLFGEMLLILCYFLLPYVMDKYINSNGVVILNDARKLNSSNMIINGYQYLL